MTRKNDRSSDARVEDAQGKTASKKKPAVTPNEPTAEEAQARADAVAEIESLRRKGFGRLLVEGQAVTIDDRTASRTVRYVAVEDGVAPASVRAALNRSQAARIAARR